MAKYLITGAAGFIGSHLCESLLKQGHSLIGIDNFNAFYDPALKRQNINEIETAAQKSGSFFQCLEGDIVDENFVKDVFKSHTFDALIHLAAMAGVRPSIQNPQLYEQVNGLGTVNLLEASRKAGLKTFILGSSSSVYGLNTKVPFSETDLVDLPFSPYAQTKRANELQCRVYHQLYGMSFACLRFFTVYGPRQRPDLAIRKFTDLMVKDKPIPILGDGSYQRDFTYVDDIIDGVVKSLKWAQAGNQPRFDIFNLGESATTTVLRLIELLEDALGKKAIKDFQPAIAGDVPITYADITKSKKVLGYDPKTPLEDGIPQFVAWYRQTYGIP